MKMAEAMKAEISCMLKGIDRYAQSQIENLNFAYLMINKSDSKIFVLFLSFFFRSLEINITFFLLVLLNVRLMLSTLILFHFNI